MMSQPLCLCNGNPYAWTGGLHSGPRLYFISQLVWQCRQRSYCFSLHSHKVLSINVTVLLIMKRDLFCVNLFTWNLILITLFRKNMCCYNVYKTTKYQVCFYLHDNLQWHARNINRIVATSNEQITSVSNIATGTTTENKHILSNL